MLADPVGFAGTERFEIRRRLGAGAMGVVYEAFDRERAMAVALKVLRNRAPDSLYRLKQEMRALAGISHPNLVALHELHARDGAWFFSMELLDGVDLVSYVGRDEHRLRACMAQLAQGVAALHTAHRLHRDVKPSNVLVTREPRVVVLDFSVIAEIGRSDGAFVGTPAYAAPEQARGTATPASDWYALGVVLYQLLTGALPYTGTARAVLFDKGHYDAQPVRVRNPDAPRDLAALCDALLRRDPETRPRGSEVLRRLDVAPQRRAATPALGVVRATADDMLIGREAARATLRDAFAATARGQGGVVHLRGASGIGKSTLLRAFASELERDSDAVVLVGRCYAQESVPYKAVDSVIDALARHLGALPAAEADALLPRDILLLAHVFPVLAAVDVVARARRRRGPVPEPLELRRRAFAALRELIERIAEHRPIAILIDDLQWGDVDSAPMLDALVLPPDPPALLLVLAYRAEDEDRAPLLAALRQRRERLGELARVIDIELAPLGEHDARTLAAAHGSDGSASARIALESGGVPFLIRELALASRDAPASLEHLIEHRLRELPRDEREIVQLIALAAKPMRRAALLGATGLRAEELERGLARVIAARLVRVVDDRYECYHDRIREALAGGLAPALRCELHARLAGALVAGTEPDLEALVVHCEHAGDPDAAGRHALAAAEQARRALAFDRAAQLYATALRLAELDAASAREVRAALGDALAHAGHGADAAEVYLAAARDAPAAAGLELRRKAASQYLRTGRVDDGLRVLADVLGEVGVRMSRSPRRALASLAWNRARLRLRPRGLAFEPRDPTRIAPYELARIDVLSTAATDLGMVDPVMGADFGTRQLARALDLGEPSRVARALVAEAMFLAARGERTWNRVEAILVRAEELAAELADPELPAWIAAARGMRAYQVGQFKRACEYNKVAVRQLREECTGVLWQVGGVEVQVMWSLFYLGELRELMERVDAGLEQARLRGNRFDGANLGTGVPSLAWAVADRTAQGRTVVANAMAQWSPRGFHLQHYYALVSLASFDLYDGDPHTAYARIDATWPALERSRLMVCRSVAIGAQHLRGRVALAAGHDATPALAALERLAHNPWATAFAHLLRAGMHDDPRAFTTAIDALLAIDVVAFASAARRRRGELLDDPKLVARADRELAERGVRCPERFARMLVPLRRDHDGAPTT